MPRPQSQIAENHLRPLSHVVDTPAVVLNRPRLEENARQVLSAVREKGIDFRAHVKTLKVS